MRNAIAPYFTVVVLSTVIFLVAVPQETQCQDPLSIAKGAVSMLTPFVNSYGSSVSDHVGAENVKIRLWMHNGDPSLNGCGFFFMVTGYSGGVGSDYFPSVAEHKCGNDTYEMRMTSQSAMYDKEIHLGNEQAKTIELRADGWSNTCVKVMCIEFNEQTIAGGPRAFCINNQILKGCKLLTDKWDDVDIDWSDILLTRSSRGAHKIVFRDIENLVSGFERIERNGFDMDAFRTVCDRIDLEPGVDNHESWECSATKVNSTGNFSSLEPGWRNENKSPYGCTTITNN